VCPYLCFAPAIQEATGRDCLEIAVPAGWRITVFRRAAFALLREVRDWTEGGSTIGINRAAQKLEQERL